MSKKLITMLCFLSLTMSAYAAESEGQSHEEVIIQTQNTELTLEFQKMIELMLERGLVVPKEDGDGVTLTDKGRSIIDQLREEGQVEVYSARGGSICW